MGGGGQNQWNFEMDVLAPEKEKERKKTQKTLQYLQ